MRNALVVVATWFIVSSLCLTGPVRAQDGTDTEITFTASTNKAAADHPSIDAATQQLRRILAEYDLDPWIIT